MRGGDIFAVFENAAHGLIGFVLRLSGISLKGHVLNCCVSC